MMKSADGVCESLFPLELASQEPAGSVRLTSKALSDRTADQPTEA